VFFFQPVTTIILGDAKKTLTSMIQELKKA